jgi:hypothetical protein
MRGKNMKPSIRNIVLISILVTLSMLLMSAGCVDSAPKNPPEVPASTCSVDTGVCPVPIPGTVRIDASPQMYSPTMSSTIGIGLTPNVSGFKIADAQFEWNATYGHFYDWSAPDYTVSRLSQPITAEPASPLVPVIITVTARDITSKKPLASSRLTLGWKDNMTVVVEKTE